MNKAKYILCPIFMLETQTFKVNDKSVVILIQCKEANHETCYCPVITATFAWPIGRNFNF